MNEIVNKILLVGDKLMPEIHLRQPGFTCSACGPFTKNLERIQKFKERGDSQYIYQNELDKACFQNDMACEDFKEYIRRTASGKIFHDKAFNIGKNLKYDGYQCRIASMVHKFFDKKTYATRARSDTLRSKTLATRATPNKFAGSGIKNENISNKELAEELYKPIIRNLKKEKYNHVL